MVDRQQLHHFEPFDDSHEAKLVPKNLLCDMFDTQRAPEGQSNDANILALKLNSTMRIEPTRYDAERYRIESEIVFTNEQGKE